MSKLRFAVAVLAAVDVSGCSIHPLPENVTGIPTYPIVRKIRCEARDAIRTKIIKFLNQVEGDPNATKYGAELQENPALWAGFNDKWFSHEVTAMLQKFEGSAIAYNFTFDMTEINNVDATVDLIAPITRGTIGGPVTAGLDRTRENIRTFTITDKWINLIKNLDDVYCDGFVHEANYIYPITGKVGIDEMIDTFVVLSLFANLSGAPPTMADSLIFTTKLSGGLTPKIIVAPIGRGLSVADASLASTLSRQDMHKVTVGLSLPVPPAAKTTTTSRKPKELLISANGDATAQAAAQAVEQLLTRFELRATPLIINNP
jgi:hypothetical protein